MAYLVSSALVSWTNPMRFARFVWCLALFVSLLLSGCGFVPTESKLAGTWQVDLARPQKIIYAFHWRPTRAWISREPRIFLKETAG